MMYDVCLGEGSRIQFLLSSYRIVENNKQFLLSVTSSGDEQKSGTRENTIFGWFSWKVANNKQFLLSVTSSGDEQKSGTRENTIFGWFSWKVANNKQFLLSVASSGDQQKSERAKMMFNVIGPHKRSLPLIK